jgi:hypothetical protein
MLHRVGNFLLIIGLVFLLYFFASDQSENPQFLLFFGGVVISLLGVYVWWRFHPRPEESERFRSLRKMGQRMKKKK